jgi:hypothetical protein
VAAEGVLRIANCSGFFGDRFSAAREMVEGGPIDVLTGDYLAELTMLILWKNKQRNELGGYATTFLKQMEQILGTCLERHIKVVVNAGGLNPRGLAAELRGLADRLGLNPRIAFVEGDDLIDALPDLLARGHDFAHLDTQQPLAESGVQPISANVYLGAQGIVEGLRAGADIVLCPRVSDASLVVGPCAWAFDWAQDDWDAIAGAVAAGHVLECGAQATGGNYSFVSEIENPIHPGFPLAEMHADGSAVITKHEGTGGQVSVGTVTAQLVYEIDQARYMNPDVVARFDTLELEQLAPDRVLMTGARGEPAPDTLKVSINYAGGFRHTVKFQLTGLDIPAKARLAEEGFFEEIGGRDQFAEVDVQLIRSDRPGAEVNAEAVARLEITLKDPDPDKLGRRVFDAMVALALSSYAGFYVDLDRAASAYGVYWPALVSASVVPHRVVLPDGRSVTPPEPPRRAVQDEGSLEPSRASAVADGGDTRRAPLGELFGARSGDKGGNANVGLWARSDEAYGWMVEHLTVDAFRALLPEAATLEITRSELPGLRALNFVVRGLLGEGVASSTRPDAQAKGLGEFIRSRTVDLPVALLDAPSNDRDSGRISPSHL